MRLDFLNPMGGIAWGQPIWVKFLSLHILHKNGHLFAEVETLMWQLREIYDKKQHTDLHIFPIEQESAITFTLCHILGPRGPGKRLTFQV